MAARSDDSNRLRALTMGASALHCTKSLRKQMTLKALAKKMIDYTRHACNEDDEAYKGIVQVCKDF